jgi:hypothetical protein
VDELIATRPKELNKLPKLTAMSPPEFVVHGRAALRVLRSDRNDAYKALETPLDKLSDEAKSILQEAKDIQAIKGKPDAMMRSTRVFVNTASEYVSDVKDLRTKLNAEEDEMKQAMEEYEKTLGDTGQARTLAEAQAMNRLAETRRKEAWKKGGKKTRRRHR